MQRLPYVMAAATLAASVSAMLAPASAMAADVGVSINVGQPGFYGQIDIGNVPRPVLVAPQPVIVQAPVGVVAPAPVYLRVPPGHSKHWARHCAEYNACGRPVYFVREDWYNNVYVPRYRHDHPEHFAREDHERDRHWDRGRGDHDDQGEHRGRGHRDRD